MSNSVIADAHVAADLDVKNAYRLFFARSPENQGVIDEKIGLLPLDLMRCFVTSEEFELRVVRPLFSGSGAGAQIKASRSMTFWVETFFQIVAPPGANRAALLGAVLRTEGFSAALTEGGVNWSVPEFLRRIARFTKNASTSDAEGAGVEGAAAPALPDSAGMKVRVGIEGIHDGVLHGWVAHGEERTPKISVLSDGRLIAVVEPAMSRKDVFHTRDERTPQGFELPLPLNLLDDEAHSVVVRIGARDFGSVQSTLLADFAEGAPYQEATVRFGLDALFDAAFYSAQVGPLRGDPLEHYRSVGWRKGYNPHPLFVTNFYIAQRQGDLVGDPLYDFYALGRFNAVSTHPVIDFGTYIKRRPDVIDSRIHPTIHYMLYGWKEPSVDLLVFQTAYYLSHSPGLIELGVPPLVHYLQTGWLEGRRPHPEFDPMLFAKQAELSENEEPLAHFVETLLASRQDRSIGPKTGNLTFIILNINKPVMTLQCLYFLRRHAANFPFNVIVFDNGSAPDQFETLCIYAGQAKVMRSEVNLGFGEGNNVAAEAVESEYIAFLNNDVYVGPNWLAPLMATLTSSDEIAAVGPKMIYPNGVLQEAGGSISADGSVNQYGKGLDARNPLFCYSRKVDYISAAALLMRTRAFRDVLGFDLCWDPAYYEDVDLCLKLKLNGGQVWYVHRSTVIHLENSTSSDAGLNLNLHNVVAANRLKFVHRWSTYLSGLGSGGERSLLVPPPSQRVVSPRLRIGLFTPYPLNPGGGERYLLSIASLLGDIADFTLYTLQPVSKLRIRTLGRELGLDLDHVELGILGRDRPPAFDYFISMGNEVLPMAPALGKRNIYICQFPFPMQAGHYSRDWGNYDAYDTIFVYSDFSKWHYLKAVGELKLTAKPCHVVAPPVPQVLGDRVTGGVTRILNVGRFHPGGHCKRQDVMIKVIENVIRATDKPVELHLAGALGSDHTARSYLADLHVAANNLPIFFHINALPTEIEELYRTSQIYWHATGIRDDVETRPHNFEHFGITILEAMSSAAVPIVLKYGGPAEIVTHGDDGFLIADAADMVRATLDVINMSEPEVERISANAKRRASQFSPANFRKRLLVVLGLEMLK